jgi:hypothetical protein
MALFKATKEAPVAAEGESSAECLRVGQSLVEAGNLSSENFAAALAKANGDLLAFADALLAAHGVGRTELALAISQATGVPAVDTKGIVIAEELKGVLDEQVVRRNCAVAVAEEGNTLVVLCVDPAPTRRQAVEAAAGRQVKFFISDPMTVRTFIDTVYRADADIDRLVKSLDLDRKSTRLNSSHNPASRMPSSA